MKNNRSECNPHENGMKIEKGITSESTVEHRFKKHRYERKVSLREYSRATDHFDYVYESQFRRKNHGYHFSSLKSTFHSTV